MKIFKKILGSIIALVVVLAATAVWRILARYSVQEIFEQVLAIPKINLLMAALATALSYSLLCGYDWLALKYLRRKLSWWKIVGTSFVAYSFSNNIGLASLAGSSIRLKAYLAWGLEPRDVVRIIIFCSVTYWSGFAAISGLSFLLTPSLAAKAIGINWVWPELLGLVFGLVALAYLLLLATKRNLYLRSMELILPSPSLGLAQIVVAASEVLSVAAVLYFLIGERLSLSFLHITNVYICAQIAALVTHVPGGLGVIEAVVFVLLNPQEQHAQVVMAGLLVFRLLYYLFPMSLGGVTWIAYELWRHRQTKQAGPS